MKTRAREHTDSDAQRKVQKCSVSVCRINTTLGPGATFNVRDGDKRLIVVTPDDSGSPFKVYEDNQASTQERKSASIRKRGVTDNTAGAKISISILFSLPQNHYRCGISHMIICMYSICHSKINALIIHIYTIT